MKLSSHSIYLATKQLAHKLSASLAGTSHRSSRHRHTTSQLLHAPPARKPARKTRRK